MFRPLVKFGNRAWLVTPEYSKSIKACPEFGEGCFCPRRFGSGAAAEVGNNQNKSHFTGYGPDTDLNFSTDVRITQNPVAVEIAFLLHRCPNPLVTLCTVKPEDRKVPSMLRCAGQAHYLQDFRQGASFQCAFH